MLKNQYAYSNIYTLRFLNKFYFIDHNNINDIKNISFEFHNTKNEKNYLTYFSFLEEFIGFYPYLIKKNFKYNSEGKKIFNKDIKLTINSSTYFLNFLKLLYFIIIKNKFRMIKSINSNNININLIISDINLSLYRDLFSLITTLNFKIYFKGNNKYLMLYFFKNFGIF